MLIDKDIDYANQVNELDEQRIIRALEVIEITGKSFSSQIGLNSEAHGLQITLMFINMEFLKMIGL